MSKFSLIKQFIVGIVLLFSLVQLHAADAQSPFTLVPTTPTSIQIPENGQAVVQYRVMNHGKVPRTLTMVPIVGITQLTGSADECTNAFMLTSNQTCLLTLQLNGSQLPEQVTQGPVVCKTRESGDKSPDPFFCFQPSKTESLNIRRLHPERAALSVSPATQTLTACGSSGDFTITNNSNAVTATNILANLTGTALVGNVSQNASNCSNVAPGQSCTLTFTPECIGAVSLASFSIQGDNTQQVGASIAVELPGDAPISVTSGSPLTLQGTTGAAVSGALTVTNNSPILTATNIAADLSGALATGGVTQNATDCASLAHGASCTLTFTPGNQAVTTTSVIIQGSNTTQTTATIAVNAAPQASISIIAGSPMSLRPSGSDGTMTISNLSSTERALNITAHFTGTALSGKVSQTASTCSSVNPGASCVLTFTPGSTDAVETNFPIQGNNTTAATGTMAINTTAFAYIANQLGNSVSQCKIDSSTGDLSACSSTGSGFSQPSGVTFNNGFAYINNLSAGVQKCTVNSLTGTLSACSSTGSGFNQPSSVAFNNGFAYISNINNSRVSQCTVDPSSGAMSNCVITGSGFSSPYSITINNGYAYIANIFTGISRCTITPLTGALSACALTGSGFSLPMDIAFNQGFAYIVNFSANTVSKCTVNPLSGALSSCAATVTGLRSPRTIAVTNNYAYIGNQGTNLVSKCAVDAVSGALSNCISTGSGFNGPAGIGILAP